MANILRGYRLANVTDHSVGTWNLLAPRPVLEILLIDIDRMIVFVYTVYIVYSVNSIYGGNPMDMTRREQQRKDMLLEIKEVARRQMAEVGASALSLRAISREIGMTAPALYRYYENRDALVTELIIDAYNALAEAMIAADAEQQSTAYASRFEAVAGAYRAWAIAHPEDYKLIYGTPIPGYHAPRERTVEPGGRVQQTIGMVLIDASRAGKLQIPQVYTNLPAGVGKEIDLLLQYLPQDVPAAGVAVAILIWSSWHGLVWAELTGHFPPGMADSGELYEMEVAAAVERLKLRN